MFKHSRSGLRALSVLLIVLALVAAACGSDDDDDSGGSDTTTKPGGASVKITGVPGVTDTEIRFASFGTNSNNPLGTCVLDCYDDGIKAYFAYRNSQGGLFGRKLVLSKELDDELGKNKEKALEIISANDVFGAFSATQIASGWADISKANIPLWPWSIHPEGQRPNIFGYNGATCYDCTNRTVAYIAKLEKATKVASLGYGVSENSKLCAQGVEKAFNLYSKDLNGAKVVYLNDQLQFGLGNGVAPEVTAMKKAGVQLVSTCIDLNGAKTVAQEMERQGMGDVPIYHPNTYNQEFIKAAGDLFEGDYVGVGFRPFEAKNNDALAQFKKWMDKGGAKLSEMSMLGWLNADLAYVGIEAAGEQFDRQKVIDATNKLTAYSADGLINPIDWTRQHEPPTQEDPGTHGYAKDCVILLEIHDQEMAVVGDASKPWLCWPGGNRAWSEPVETDFE